MTEENAQSTAATAAEASAKKGGTQFIIKMIFLALVVLAIVFYVRSLDHKAPATATAVPSPAPEAEVKPEQLPPAGGSPAPAAPATPPVTAAEQAEPVEAATPRPEEEAAAPEEQATAPEATAPTQAESADEPQYRPMTEEDMLRQIQEVFAPETLEPASGN